MSNSNGTDPIREEVKVFNLTEFWNDLDKFEKLLERTRDDIAVISHKITNAGTSYDALYERVQEDFTSRPVPEDVGEIGYEAVFVTFLERNVDTLRVIREFTKDIRQFFDS